MKEIYRRGLTVIGGAGLVGAGTMLKENPVSAIIICLIGYVLICIARDSKREEKNGKRKGNKKAVQVEG